MDTSPEYIAMCQEAKEIQKLAPHNEEYWELGNIIKDFLMAKPCFVDADSDYGSTPYDIRDIWLPRQDQLQEMVKPCSRYESPLQLINEFDDFIEPFLIQQTGSWKNATWDYSLEQLWLAFAMHTLYSKQWDGNTWVMEGE